jgi:predicted RNA methylase
MYSVHDHGWMIADKIRTGCYVRALEKLVRPGDVVVDIGTGMGIFAILACRLGARKVYAIESADIVSLAREAARDHGCDDRIVFIRMCPRKYSCPNWLTLSSAIYTACCPPANSACSL